MNAPVTSLNSARKVIAATTAGTMYGNRTSPRAMVRPVQRLRRAASAMPSPRTVWIDEVGDDPDARSGATVVGDVGSATILT